jgi:hypothetical protein
MGITIQYRGQLKSPALIDKIRSDLKEIADRMGWVKRRHAKKSNF